MNQTETTLEPRLYSKVEDAKPSSTNTMTTDSSDEGAKSFGNQEELEELQRDLAQALAKADEYWKLYLGTRAEMENLLKRTERDIKNAHKFALERFLEELFPVRDCLEMGLEVANDSVDVLKLKEGVDLTLKQLSAAMEKFGIREVNATGTKFNPAEHEAIAVVPTDQAEPNSVIQVIQKGYVLNGRLIRPAKVLVAQGLPKS